MSEEKNIQQESSKPQDSSDKPVLPDHSGEQKHLSEESHSPKPATSNQQPAFAEASADKQATENMETHAHQLHKVPGQGWKHYLFEFLMLFLAVFAGFLAENWRESVVEHRNEKQYI